MALDVEGSLISTDQPWCRICSKTWRSICSCSTCDIYQDLEGISGYKKFISVLIPALKGCEASRWKANTDRSLTFCRHLASLSSLNLTGQVARFAAFFGEVLIATVPVYELKWLYVRESDKISINYETLEEKSL